jgi:hypothetical protein
MNLAIAKGCQKAKGETSRRRREGGDMGILSGLKTLADVFRRSRRGAAPAREAAWIVTMTDDGIRVTDPTGEVRGIAKDRIAAVIIETNDSGPWGSDFWWLVIGPDKDLACTFPQGATGESEAMGWLMALPRFDHARMIEASASTGNAFFPVWER